MLNTVNQSKSSGKGAHRPLYYRCTYTIILLNDHRNKPPSKFIAPNSRQRSFYALCMAVNAKTHNWSKSESINEVFPHKRDIYFTPLLPKAQEPSKKRGAESL